jgi:hypothetical protein
MKKRILSLTLAMLLLLSACSKTTETKSETLSSGEESTASESVAESDGDVPDIGKEDNGDRTFNLYYIYWSLYRDYYFAENLNGEIVNDAAYNRIEKVKDQLNIDFKTIAATEADGVTEQYNNLQKAVMSGDDVYDLLLIHNSSYMDGFVGNRLVLNWQDIKSVDMTKSYWSKSAFDNLTINGMTPYASNDFILPDVNSIFFNARLSADLNNENLYELVLNGDWTWDKLTEIASKASADLNGDGVYDDKDQYGFVGESDWQFASIPTSCDQYMIVKDSDGTPSLNLNTPKMVSIIEKFNKLVNGGHTSFIWPFSGKTDPNQGGTPPVSFDSGRALFYLVPLSLSKVFRETDVDFGILPFPKYDENQANYTTLNWAGFLTVPFTAGDPELTGKVSELLAYYSKSTVIPAFYNVVLGQKISRNDDSTKMLDIIFSNTVYDLGIAFGAQFYNITKTFVEKNNNDFASYYAKNENTFKKSLDNFIKAYEDYTKK